MKLLPEIVLKELHDMVIVATAIERFSSQQAAELAVNALLEKKGISRRGHSIYFMLSTIKAPEEVLSLARKLDRYISLRV